MNEKLMKVAETAVKPISRSFLSYLHLGAWLEQRVTSMLSGRLPRAFSSVADFWDALKNEDLAAGARIKFKNAFLTEWIPRLPGQVWLDKGHRSKLEGLRRGDRFGISSVLSSNVDPLGIIRLPFGSSPTDYAVLGLTTADSWHCDLGVPVLVSSSVYDSFIARRVGNNAVEGELKGVLQFGVPLTLDPGLLSCIGSVVSADFLRSISSPTGIPYVYLRTASPLDVKFRSNDSHPLGCFWCIDRELRNKEVNHIIESIKAKNPIARVEVKDVAPFVVYGFTAISAQPDEQDELEACVRCFSAGSFTFEQGSNLARPETAIGRVASEVLTEFDGRSRHFGYSVPLTQRPWADHSTASRIRRTFAELESGLSKEILDSDD